MKTFVEKNKELLKMVGSLVVVTVSATWFMSHEMHSLENRLTQRIENIDKRLTVVETVLIMQGAPIRALTQANAEATKAP
jgi:hypothetical protein